MAAEEKFDAIVIGTGQGGKPLAVALAEAGYKTAVLERDQVGGSCINFGCTPTKTMVASARVAYLASRGAEYGVETGQSRINLRTIRARKRAVVQSFRGGTEKGIAGTDNLELIRGHGRFRSPQSVEVEVGDELRVLRAGKIFINTGTRTAIPSIDGLTEADYLDSASIMELAEVPAHLIVLGGGYIGIEFAQMFRRFGSQVTIIQRPKQLLPREDEDVAEEVASILREDGIQIRLQSIAGSVQKSPEGELRLGVSGPEGVEEVCGSHLLLAAGRVPNSDDLSLDNAGVDTDDRGYIQTDEFLQTSVKNIFALGDVKGGPAFTHISYDDYRVIEANLLGEGKASTKDRLVPYTVFVDPQLGRVGLSEVEARERKIPVRVAKLPMKSVARAIEMDETRGFMKALVAAKSNEILGCAILGVEGGEVMAVLQVAMLGKLPYTAIRDGVFAHPTLAESLNNLFMQLEEG